MSLMERLTSHIQARPEALYGFFTNNESSSDIDGNSGVSTPLEQRGEKIKMQQMQMLLLAKSQVLPNADLYRSHPEGFRKDLK